MKALGLPTEFTASGTPRSPEGFLYPATYTFDDTTTVDSALQTMVGRFTDQVRSTDFTTRAKALGITPYQELIIASMVQSEAKYPGDMAKVARVILNRLHDKVNLRIDATSIYGAEVKGVDPTKIIHSTFDSPYNTYTHPDLPPTPISNPGAEALSAAVAPGDRQLDLLRQQARRTGCSSPTVKPAFEKAKNEVRSRTTGAAGKR